MEYEIAFHRHADYLHAKVVGKNSQDTVIQYMQDVRGKCREVDCFRVLIEECLDGPRLDTMEIFEMVATKSRSALGIFEAIALVDPEMGDMAEFAETVAVNRGMPLAMFGTVDDARNWLARQKSVATEQSIFLERDGAD